MKKIILDKAVLYDLYIVQNMSISSISKVLEVSEPTVSKQLKEYQITKSLSGFKHKKPRNYSTRQVPVTVEYVKQKNQNLKWSLQQMADDLKCNADVLSKIIRHTLGMTIIKHSPADLFVFHNPDCFDTIQDMRFVQKMTHASIAEKLSISKNTLKTIIQQYNISNMTSRSTISPEQQTTIIEQYNDNVPVEVIAENHKVYKQAIYQILHKNNITIKPTSISRGEKEIFEYISNLLNVAVIQSSRDIITPYELDVYIPELKIAIEYNGLYWHSEERGRGKSYHINKTNECYKKGIRLIQIFEDEWTDKPEIVKQKLKHILGVSDNRRVYARKCVVEPITSVLCSPFLRAHHIQGAGPGTINLGLFENSALVAVMNFISQKDGKYKLNRFATSCDVIGGFSKLLKYFIRTYDPAYIETFADLRWSSMDSNVYSTNKFIHVYNTEPNYFYTRTCKNRESRQKYMKHKLPKVLDTFDVDLTEYENMVNNGYYRVWDCGNMKFVWEK